MEEKQAFYVEGTDGRKFKMVIRGDLGKLSVAKIRRYLKSYGVPDSQEIVAGSLVLEDDMLGEYFGLRSEAVLHLRDPPQQLSPAKHDTDTVASVPMTSNNRPRGLTYGDQGLTPQQQQQPSFRAAASSPNTMSSRSGFQSSQLARRPEHTEAAAAAGQDVAALQQQLRDLQHSLDAATAHNNELQRQLTQALQSPAAKQGGATSATSTIRADDGLANAKECLALLADTLHVSLQFDKNLTCVVGTDEDFSILLTYDPATERLYLYSTLLTELPSDTQVRMKLYEVLLEGSLLSREVCGGGIGVSTKNSVVVLTTSLPVRYCQPAALIDVMPVFVETLGRWRDLVRELVL